MSDEQGQGKGKGVELKPCPWCGSKAFIELGKRGSCHLHGDPFQPVVVRCKNHACAAKPSVSWGDTFNGGETRARKEAAEVWNTRPREAELEAEKAAYEEVLADHRRLVRELDVALSGEQGAAEQASLCDLIGPVRALKAQCAELERKAAVARDVISEHHRWQHEIGVVKIAMQEEGKEPWDCELDLSSEYSDAGLSDRTEHALALLTPAESLPAQGATEAQADEGGETTTTQEDM